MRKPLVALVAIPLMLLLGMASCLAVVQSSQEAAEQNENCDVVNQAGVIPAMINGVPQAWYKEFTVYDGDMKEDQAVVATKIASIIGGRVDIPVEYKRRATIIALITGIVESKLRNIRYGDSDSAGVFQQRPSQGWGTFEQVTDVTYATNKFLDAMLALPSWKSDMYGDVAANVQRPAPEYRYRYQTRVAEAERIYVSLNGLVSTASELVNCVRDPIEEMVQAALSRVDQPLDSIPTSSTTRIGSFNVLGSNHTNSASAMSRIAISVDRIKELQLSVVGLQELRPDQRERMMQMLGSSYDIFPKTPVYGSSQMSANSIIWDKSQFEFVSGKSTPMPFYFREQQLDIPLVELRHRESGSVITVVNTHDPAKPENARLRYVNAQAHAELTERLTEQGAKVFWTGDFNSGFGLRDSGNTTYLNERNNLTWCIMTKSGLLVNGYDDFRGRQGCSQATTDEMGEGPVDHVYVPRDGVETVGYSIIREDTGSDHPFVFAEVTFGESGQNDETVVGTSAEFISWAAEQAGFTLPDTLPGLNSFTGSPDEGMTAELLPSGTALRRGDIPLWSTDTDPDPEQAGIELGMAPSSNYASIAIPSPQTEGTTAGSSVVAVFGKEVAVKTFDTRKFVGVLRLQFISQTALVGFSAEGWIFPLEAGTYTYTVNSYGPRSLNGDDFHNGSDFGTNGATPPLFAMYGGEIVEWGFAGAWGNYLIVETGVPIPGLENETIKYMYAHMSGYASDLSIRDTVEAGQLVGYVGDTGNSFGEHLHLTICTTMECTSGNAAGSTDPIPFLASVGIRP